MCLKQQHNACMTSWKRSPFWFSCMGQGHSDFRSSFCKWSPTVTRDRSPCKLHGSRRHRQRPGGCGCPFDPPSHTEGDATKPCCACKLRQHAVAQGGRGEIQHCTWQRPKATNLKDLSEKWTDWRPWDVSMGCFCWKTTRVKRSLV